jgi:hypothetical protein
MTDTDYARNQAALAAMTATDSPSSNPYPLTPGPRGDSGANGTNGSNGTNGTDGEPGAPGAQGEQGEQGSNTLAGYTTADLPSSPYPPAGTMVFNLTTLGINVSDSTRWLDASGIPVVA